MFKPKFCYEGEKVEGAIAIKEEPLPDDPSDDTHPTTKANILDMQSLSGPVKGLAENNWAWKFKYIDKQNKNKEKAAF